MSLDTQVDALRIADPHPGPSRSVNGSKPPSELTPRQREKAVSLQDVSLDSSQLDDEITLLISQYLDSKSHHQIARLLDEEITGKVQSDTIRQEDIEAVENAILDGDYGSLEGLLAKPGLLRPQSQRAFLYMCWRQQFLEFVENRESQKAFNLLQKRLKPLEHYQPVPYDFYNLAYLTSASTVHDAPSFRDWAGIGPERDRLVEMWKELTDSERKGGQVGEKPFVPPDRLVTLLRQAVAWQIQNSAGHRDGPYSVPTLLQDYQSFAIPNNLAFIVKGHTANVKCVDFLGDIGLGISGSSDATLRIFSLTDGSLQHVLTGHTSRIWDCSSSISGRLVASAAGDGSVRIWSTKDGICHEILQGDGGDVYSVRWRPSREDQIVSASYDKILRSWDVESGKQIRTFSGHSQSTLAIAFDPTGNLLASGSKDKHIRLWDAVSGVCVHTMPACLGEISSVEFDHQGKYLLAGCKDSSNRLWDLRMQRNLYRYTGHQNTSKNLIRAHFASPSSSLVISGSEDGQIYLWEREGSEPTTSFKFDSKEKERTVAIPDPYITPLQPSVSTFASPPLIASSRTPYIPPIPTKTSAAYYPPRDRQPTASSGRSSTTAATTVRPLDVIEGHAEGPVYDVRWSITGGGRMVSANQDGGVGVWRTSDISSEKDESPDT